MAELDPSLSPDVRAVADRVRSFFRDSFPEIEERVYAGAKSVGYRTAEAGTICGLFVRGAHVHLVFTRGSQVPDPSHLLRGDGEGVRYITFRKWSDVDEESLYPLVVAALLVGGGAADGIQPPLP